MTKAEAIRQFLKDYGLDISYSEAKTKFKKYGGYLPESSFYGIRRTMRLEKASGADKPVGICELVRAAKELIAACGKDEAKALIDSL